MGRRGDRDSEEGWWRGMVERDGGMRWTESFMEMQLWEDLVTAYRTAP